MADTNVPPPLLPAHIEETIRSIARLRAEHHQSTTPLQRAVDRITALLGRPRFIGMLIVIAAAWISLNLLVTAFGYRPIDPPPFSGLGGAVSLISLYMVVLILATQRREYQLAQLREQLTLELAILSEQKTAKVIQLLEKSPVGIIRSFAIASIKKPRRWLNLLTRNRCCRRSKKPTPKRSRSVVWQTAPSSPSDLAGASDIR